MTFGNVREKTFDKGKTTASDSASTRRLRLLSYNIQVAVASTRLRHYVTQSWKHFLPHQASMTNLDRIADVVCDYDIVALQEVDAGSLRSAFVNQVQYLADKGRFPFWYYQTNRNLGRVAQHSNGLLSQIKPADVAEHKLPGLIPGRGAILVRYGHHENPLVFMLVHLALGKRARLNQIHYLSDIVCQHKHVVVMGDFNCQPHSIEINSLLHRTHLRPPFTDAVTFPSWRPNRKLDYILVSPSLDVHDVKVLNHAVSDHLPISMEISAPADVELFSY
jgi:endonuclease/exonuclease/phosphatase family metal-dependent hydrolase